MEETGGLLSMGSHGVGHHWSDLACMHAWEKEMATHSSIFAWRIPGTEEPGGLPSMGSHGVRHHWSDLAAAAAVLRAMVAYGESEVKVLVMQLCLTLRKPMDCSLPGSYVHGFSRQEYWSGWPFPSPGNLPNPGIEPGSPTLQADSSLSEPPGNPPVWQVLKNVYGINKWMNKWISECAKVKEYDLKSCSDSFWFYKMD